MAFEKQLRPRRTATELEQHGSNLRAMADQRRGTVLDRAANILGLEYGTRRIEGHVRHTERELVVARYEEGAGAAAVETNTETFADVIRPDLDALSGISDRHMRGIRHKSDLIVHEQAVPRPWAIPRADRRLADQHLVSLESKMAEIENAIKTNDRKSDHAALRALDYLLRLGDHIQVRLAHAIVEHTLDVLVQSHHLAHNAYDVFRVISSVDGTLQQRFEEQCLQNIAGHTLSAEAVRKLLANGYADLVSWDDSRLAKQATTAMITRYGFKPEELTSLWDATKALGDSEGSLYPDKLATMYAIEAQNPGATRRLYDDFGIAVYDRYPAEVLITQDQQRDDDTLSYGVLVAGRADQGLFTAAMVTANRLIGSVAKQLQKGGYALRIIEVGGRYSLVKRHLQLDERYGASHKIGFGLELVHGKPDHMSYGRGEKSGKVKTADLDGPIAARVLATYEVDAPQVLISCSTGREGGFGQKLSERSGPVTAPQIPIETPDITVEFEPSGKPQFLVTYGDVIRTYQSGEQVA